MRNNGPYSIEVICRYLISHESSWVYEGTPKNPLDWEKLILTQAETFAEWSEAAIMPLDWYTLVLRGWHGIYFFDDDDNGLHCGFFLDPDDAACAMTEHMKHYGLFSGEADCKTQVKPFVRLTDEQKRWVREQCTGPFLDKVLDLKPTPDVSLQNRRRRRLTTRSDGPKRSHPGQDRSDCILETSNYVSEDHMDIYGTIFHHEVESLGGGKYLCSVRGSLESEDDDSRECDRNGLIAFWRDFEGDASDDVPLRLFLEAGDAQGITDLLEGDDAWLDTPTGKEFQNLHWQNTPASPSRRRRFAEQLTMEKLIEEMEQADSSDV